jgi:hypothetical protein
MALTINTKSFTPDRYGQDAIGYVGPANTLSVADALQLTRVYPKPTALFSGVGRSSAKLTRTLTLTNALTTTANAIVQINVSVPVGAAAADVEAMLADMGSFLSGTDVKSLAEDLQISF